MKKLKIVLFIFAFLVIGFGAFTRLKDAGLGCPDWPGCYGHVLYPQTHQEITNANIEHPNRPFDEEKHANMSPLPCWYTWNWYCISCNQKHNQKRQTSSYLIFRVLLFQNTWCLDSHNATSPACSSTLTGGFSIATLLFYRYCRSPFNLV